MHEIVIPEATARSRNWREAAALAEQFPSIPVAEITAILIEARRGVSLFGLVREEEQQMAERIAVAQLRQRTGEDEAKARLDPERHARRRSALTADGLP